MPPARSNTTMPIRSDSGIPSLLSPVSLRPCPQSLEQPLEFHQLLRRRRLGLEQGRNQRQAVAAKRTLEEFPYQIAVGRSGIPGGFVYECLSAVAFLPSHQRLRFEPA